MDDKNLSDSQLEQLRSGGSTDVEIVERANAIHPGPVEFTATQVERDPILRYFHYAHLPPVLQGSSKPFCDLAMHIVENTPRNAERSVALRKLLEAKDAAVRASVSANAESGNRANVS